MSKTPSNLSETSFKTISTIRHDNSQTIDNKRNNELEDINYRIKDVSKNNKPYQELNQCSYNEYLSYNQYEFIKENDYIWKDDNLYFILDFNKKTNIFTLINLETNQLSTVKYPFYYCKIDGNDPNVLYNYYINIKNKNK